MKDPVIIALNGFPGSGKSEVQKILERRFRIKPVDDGAIIRRHCQELFGLSQFDVLTQQGKSSYTEIQGEMWENRKILGEYGAFIEKTFGEYTVPNYAVSQALRQWKYDRLHHDGYSFGSVRRGQGKVYLDHGGIVIEVRRPGVEQSGNIWDTFDQRWVSYTFVNNGNDLESLERDFVAFFTEIADNQDRSARIA